VGLLSNRDIPGLGMSASIKQRATDPFLHQALRSRVLAWACPMVLKWVRKQSGRAIWTFSPEEGPGHQ